MFYTRFDALFSSRSFDISASNSNLGNDKVIEEEVVYERRKPKVPPSRH